MTPEKYSPRKSTAEMMSSLSNNVSPLIKMSNFPNMGNKYHYEGSEVTETDHSHCWGELKIYWNNVFHLYRAGKNMVTSKVKYQGCELT